jgi:signal transduction histidine kinase
MQVLLNLLVNSIDAVQSRPADHRRIVVEARPNGAPGEVEIAVRDSGPGIPDKIVKDVFEPFFTTKSKGLGTGLALARTIVEAHGGRLWIDNMPEQEGAIFRFTLREAPNPEYLAEKGRDPPSTRALLSREAPVNGAI